MSNRLSYKTTSGELHFQRLILFSLISPGAEPGVLHKSSHLFSLATLSGKCYESHFLDEGMKAQLHQLPSATQLISGLDTRPAQL